jgi:hypothetical protein
MNSLYEEFSCASAFDDSVFSTLKKSFTNTFTAESMLKGVANEILITSSASSDQFFDVESESAQRVLHVSETM